MAASPRNPSPELRGQSLVGRVVLRFTTLLLGNLRGSLWRTGPHQARRCRLSRVGVRPPSRGLIPEAVEIFGEPYVPITVHVFCLIIAKPPYAFYGPPTTDSPRAEPFGPTRGGNVRQDVPQT